MTVDDSVPFWLVNVPPAQQPSECPDFLRNANAKDQGILATRDEDYHRLNWGEVKRIIGTTTF